MSRFQQKCWIFLALLSSLSFSYGVVATQLNQIAVVQQQPNLILKFATTGQDGHRVFVLHHPERLVIDFKNTASQVNPSFLVQTTHLIKTARMGRPQAHILRLVLETKGAVNFNTNLVAHGWQLRIIPRSSGASNRNLSSNKINTMNRRSASANRDVIIVLDPGHGGKDPGAIGSHRTREKDVVLGIARRLKTYIDRQPGMRAVLTRNGDYYIGLRERMAIARRHNADLFIAIHADAYENRNSHGASVFALSQRGATSEAARWLAAKENYSELGGVNLSKIKDQNGVIRSVLIDLSQTATISASLQLGHQVLHGLNRMTDLHSHKVEQARFMVLKSPDIPSLLIETGFISNPREEMNLVSAGYQSQLCQAIVGGIQTYFWDYPPHGSKIAALAARRQVISYNESSRRR